MLAGAASRGRGKGPGVGDLIPLSRRPPFCQTEKEKNALAQGLLLGAFGHGPSTHVFEMKGGAVIRKNRIIHPPTIPLKTILSGQSKCERMSSSIKQFGRRRSGSLNNLAKAKQNKKTGRQRISPNS